MEAMGFSFRLGARTKEIVKGLLEFSRPTKLNFVSTSVNDAVENVLTLLDQQGVFYHIKITKDLADRLPWVVADPTQLEQVFMNIIKNALQALPEGRGVIRLATRYHEEKERVVVECRDTGKGIPPEHVKDIFKPFFTTNEAGQGTGLGLYISHEIIKKHGGHIEVSSEMERGSIFRVELPLCATPDEKYVPE